ncbi:hypothetical protein [Streptococcus phocae]|uniref:Uncharacterized protein n=1 Tax=Streptococcus phocae TaxID=119224 RepID=A0A0P6S776_9STRE|nr:hypothetical protein [Streptococcus phocae]KPJ22125.1 hypothetical protein AKK44_06175 [Streptococcus phocae]
MKIKKMLMNNQLLSYDELDFILSVAPSASSLLDMKDNDDNWDNLVDKLQQISIDLIDDGESVSDKAKRFDSLVDKISAI